MPYLDLAGHRTYHEVAGDGPPVVLLHGGASSLEDLRGVAAELVPGYRVHAAERPGHGRTPDLEGPFSYDGMVADTLAYLDALGLSSVHVVGYSDGGIAGLLMARDHPERVRSLVAISANLDPTAWVPEEQHERAVPLETLKVIEEQYAALSPDGPEHGPVVEEKLYALWAAEPNIPAASLAAIAAPALVMAGEHDMVSLEHSTLIADAVRGELEVVPGTSHLLVVEEPVAIGHSVRAFLDRVSPREPAAP